MTLRCHVEIRAQQHGEGEDNVGVGVGEAQGMETTGKTPLRSRSFWGRGFEVGHS